MGNRPVVPVYVNDMSIEKIDFHRCLVNLQQHEHRKARRAGFSTVHERSN